MRRFPHLNRHGHDAMKNPETNCFRVFLAPPVRLELTTLRLTAECSAIELRRNVQRRTAAMGSGGDLCFRAVTSQVLSALKGLTSVFGMGTGGTPSLLPPEMVSFFFAHPDNRTGTFKSLPVFFVRLSFESSPRPISAVKLHPLPDFHRRPISW